MDSGSILSFGQLAREFTHHFGNFKKRKKPYSCLAEVIQGPEESFSAFIHRFDAVAITVGELPLTLRLDYLYSNTNHRRFADELSDCPPKTMPELSALKEKHMAGDDYRRSKASVKKSNTEGNHDKKLQSSQTQKRPENQNLRRERKIPSQRPHFTYTALKCPREQILKNMDVAVYEVRWPRKHRENRATKESSEVCRFHKQRGHSTESCIDLMNEIERLLDLGHLTEFRVGRNRGAIPRQERRQERT